jgi:hypothetical protein
LTSLNCSTNLLASLDLSQNVALSTLNCAGNQLASLDVSNNLSLSNFDARFNPSLTCIQVDNESDANAGLPPYDNWLKDNDARYSEDCSTLSIYFGDLTLSSQAEVDAFIYTEVTGRLTISGNDINDLSPLSSLITVSGGFYIDNNDALTSLVGLENLSSVGEYVWIQNNEILSSLSSLSSLTSVGGYIWIFNNDVLKNLNGLENITSVVGSLAVSNNDKLTSLSGLENITSVGGYISFSGNALLTSLNELGNLTSVGESIRILSNAALTSLSGLENITSIVEDLVINNNNVLTSLVGLENITSVGEDINISYNDVLTSFCSLYELINGGGLTGTYTVTGNAVNLTQQEIIDGGSCPRIYIGDLSLHFQSEVNAFNYSEVTGSLTINGSDITDLTPLSSLTSVGENLRVYYNTVLSSLSGLENLVSLRGLIIYNNPALTNLSGLNNVALIEGHLDIHGNPALTSLSGLVNVTSIEGNFRIFENPALTSLSGLLKLTSVVGDVWIWNNPVLSSIFEPSTLTSVGGKLDIYENPELISISGFSSIDGGVYIALNPALVNLFDLSTLTSVGGTFAIISNESLTCLFDLSTLTSVGEGFTISNNPSLTRLSGLEVLTSIGGPLQIVKNGLTSLSGLETLNTVGALNISDNTSLNSLSGLEALTFVMGDVIIWYNPSLASLFELSSLTTVEGNIYIASNASITGLSGLENLNSVKGDLDILHNTALTHFCTLYDLMDIGGLTGTYSVTGNAYNPAQQEIIDNGPCNLSVNIPDTNFEQSLIDLGIDSDDKINKQILRSDAEGVILLNLSNPTENSNLPNVEAKIADLTGIEAFVDLQTLLCNDNLLTSLNLSQHNYLNTLQCRSNQLTGLDVSANHGLVNLSCEHNQISELDIGQNSALASIDCSYNLLSELDVSNNPSLTRIFCAGNQLSALDVSNNIALDYLYMNQNSIGSLDVTNNTELTFLICYDNNLKSLDISQNTKLYGLSCYENQLSTLDLSNNPSLTELQCRDNQLTELNIKNGNNANVTRFSAHNNLLSCINVDNELDDHSTWQADPGVIFSNDCGYNTQRGVDVKVALLDKITSEKTAEVTFDDVESSGETTIEVTKEVVSISPINFIGEKTVYNIETTAEYAGDIDITIDYAKEDIVNEDGIRLFHKKGETWEDVTTSVDKDNDEVHGTTSSLSPFVIVEVAGGEIITLLNSNGVGLPGGTVKYYASGWQDVEGETGANGEIVVDLPENVIPSSWKMYYAGASLQKNNPEKPIVFQTVNVSMDLASSTGEPLASDDAKYYAGGWKQFGDGVTSASMELLPNNYSFKVYYLGGSNQMSQDVSSDPNVVFETVNVSMDLASSTGAALSSDDAKYYASGWKQFGTGVTSTSMELLPDNYPFKVYYLGGSNQKSQDVNSDAYVVFETVNVTMDLVSSTGGALSSDDAKYYAGDWKQFGDGVTSASMELLPNNYPFKVYYLGGSNQKSQDVGTDTNVVFTTGLVSMNLVSSTGTSLVSDDAKYYAGGWLTFGTGNTETSMELLPNNYPFKVYYAGASNQKSQFVENGSTVDFSTTEVTMTLAVDGNPEVGSNAQYYAGGWKTFGSGITETSMELLPNNYPFKVYYAGTGNQQSQDVGINPIVAFDIATSGARLAANLYNEKNGIFSAEDITIYPNPVKDIFTVQFGETFSEKKGVKIHLYNLTGVDMIENHERSISNNRLEIDINDLPSGIYILVIPYQEHQFKHKLTKL